MQRLSVLLLSSFLVSPALAQSTPPPPKNATGSVVQSTGQQLGQVLFSAAEKKIIEGFFGHSATSTTTATDTVSTATGQVLKQVLDTVVGQTTSGSSSTTTSSSTSTSSEQGPEGAEGGEGGKTGKDKSKKKDKKSKKDKGKKDKGKGKNKNKKMPAGLAKRKSLPPGLQKQLDKNGRLPPGLAKRDLPGDLNTQLPPEQTGTERVIAGNDVVLVDQATGIILDVLRDVVTGQK